MNVPILFKKLGWMIPVGSLFFACSKQELGEVKTSSGVDGKLSNTENVVLQQSPVVLVDASSFNNYTTFEQKWNYLYPWGSDHNGTARMYGNSTDHNHIYLTGTDLNILATRINWNEGNSPHDPYLPIRYHSGAIHLKEKITFTDALPYWEIRGDFQVPTVRGSWPAFWLTGADSWPPESDIMEFKGDSRNWQNTATGPSWQNVTWQNKITPVTNAGNWHNYMLRVRRVSATHVDLDYYIDNQLMATHRADFMNKPFWLIINMQMEGSSGEPGPQEALMKARNIYVAGSTTAF